MINLGIQYVTQSATALTFYNVSSYMKQMIATMHFVHGRFERAVESARKTGAISTRIWHSKQPVYIINMVHDVKTRVASSHEMKFNTNIV